MNECWRLSILSRPPVNVSWFVVAAIASALFCGMNVSCSRDEPADTGPPLLCYVGGTMRPVMDDLAAQYKSKTGSEVMIDYGGSGELLIRIETTGKGDLYVCHDPFLGALMNKGLGKQGWTAASLTPVIAVSRKNEVDRGLDIRGLADLAKPGVKVGLTDPQYSTAGRLVKVMMDKSGIELKPETVTRQGGAARNAVAVGQLDATIVWNAVAFTRRDKLRAVPIEPKWMPARGADAVTSATFGRVEMDYIRVTIATLACSDQPKRAKAFAEFVASREGQKTFARYGFCPADPTRSVDQAIRPALTGSIFIHCGAGMQKPIDELAREFTASTAVEVRANYAGSNVLFGQIDLTKKGDVYIPGDADYVEMAREKGLITFDRPVCYFVPVIMVEKGNPRQIASLADLTKARLKVGLGDPKACAIGRLMNPLFERNGVDPAAVAPNVRLRTPTVNDLGGAVKLGSIQATVVWSSIAAQYAEDSETVAIPAAGNIIPVVKAATLTTADNPPAARAFVEFLASARGREMLARHHYVVDEPR